MSEIIKYLILAVSVNKSRLILLKVSVSKIEKGRIVAIFFITLKILDFII